jgi:alanine racemase
MNFTAHPTWIEIDRAQFKKNISIIKKHVAPSLFCLPVKANAYGHGLKEMGQAAVDAGVDYLAVAHLKEAIALRQYGINIPILVLGAIHEDQIEDFIEWGLEFTISSKFKAELVAKVCQNRCAKVKVHVEIDTGMHRTGVRPDTAIHLIEFIDSYPCFQLTGVYSHLATADVPLDPHALKQIEAFRKVLSHEIFSQRKILRHMANSSACLFYPTSFFDMVRPSLLAFGYGPENMPKALAGIAPCFSLKSKVSYFKVVKEGEGISYGRGYITKKATRIVTIPIGYGDGLRRSLSNQGSILLRGRRYPICGSICMDQCMVDLGDDEGYVGDEVVLIGAQGDENISLMEVAQLCETIPYEVLCFFNERIPRIYVS